MDPIPVAGYLVPPTTLLMPDGFTRLETTLTGGLPASIDLDRELSLVLSLPTGLAMPWRHAPAADVVSMAADELEPVPDPPPPRDPMAEAPLRLQVRRGSSIVATTALSVGTRLRLPDGGDPAVGALVELVLLDWMLLAGSVRGTGNVGSRLVLAWRRADRAVSQFSEPPVNPYFEPRLPPVLRIESRPFLVGLIDARNVTVHSRALMGRRVVR